MGLLNRDLFMSFPWKLRQDADDVDAEKTSTDIETATGDLAATVYPPSGYPYSGPALKIANQRAKEIVVAVNALFSPDGPMDKIVICRADREYDGTPGQYVLATHQLFTNEQAAKYVKGVAKSREPRIVTVTEYLLDFGGFRLSRI